MTKAIKKQEGAVLFETAYLLPILLVVMLLIVEVVNYATTSFAVNDVLSDVHTRISTEVLEVSNNSNNTVLVECANDKVALKGSVQTTVTSLVVGGLNIDGLSGTTTMPKTVVSGFDVYVIEFNGAMPSLVIPDFLSSSLPIKVNTIISIRDTCTSA